MSVHVGYGLNSAKFSRYSKTDIFSERMQHFEFVKKSFEIFGEGCLNPWFSGVLHFFKVEFVFFFLVVESFS